MSDEVRRSRPHKQPMRTAKPQRYPTGLSTYGRKPIGNRMDPPHFDADKALALLRNTLQEVYGS